MSLLGMPALPEIEGIKSFGQHLRKLRISKGWTMQELANIAEIELSQVSRIETAKINPKLSTIIIIARALEISPKDFFL